MGGRREADSTESTSDKKMSETYNRREFLGMPTARRAGSSRPADQPLRLGFVGVGDRGSWHLDVALGIPGIEIPALCDINNAYLYRAKRWVEDAGMPAPRLYNRSETDFERLCAEEDLDAIICSTPWEWHVPACLAAMRNGKHAVCEVPMVVTVDEAWELVETYENTGKWATLGFKDAHTALSNMVYQGVFGEILHCESGYVHDLRLVKFDPEREPWRLKHSVHRNGNLYPDHPITNMMPVMDINAGDRFEYMVSMSSKAIMLNEYARFFYGEDHPYATQPMALGDYNVTLIRTAGGSMITLNHDTNTPHPREEFRMQGTQGVYFRQGGFGSKIYLDGVSPEEHQWEDAAPYLEKYEHPITRNYDPPERTTIRGHGSSSRRTPLEWHRVVAALREDTMTDFDVYDSVTSSVISPLSERSVGMNGRPVDFPDFTRGKWKTRPRFEARVQPASIEGAAVE